MASGAEGEVAELAEGLEAQLTDGLEVAAAVGRRTGASGLVVMAAKCNGVDMGRGRNDGSRMSTIMGDTNCSLSSRTRTLY